MRLPAINARQLERENSRQRHEDWYRAFLAGQRTSYPITPATAEFEQLRLSGNAFAFWRERGFRVRTKVSADKTELSIWLESMVGKQEAA